MLRVSVEQHEANAVQVSFSVRNNGIGMDEATRARLFSAFTQADASTTRRFGGTGLGLTIARNLVKLMAGQMSLASTPVVGSAFAVSMPFVTVAAWQQASDGSACDQPGVCVLYRESDPAQCLLEFDANRRVA